MADHIRLLTDIFLPCTRSKKAKKGPKRPQGHKATKSDEISARSKISQREVWWGVDLASFLNVFFGFQPFLTLWACPQAHKPKKATSFLSNCWCRKFLLSNRCTSPGYLSHVAQSALPRLFTPCRKEADRGTNRSVTSTPRHNVASIVAYMRRMHVWTQDCCGAVGELRRTSWTGKLVRTLHFLLLCHLRLGHIRVLLVVRGLRHCGFGGTSPTCPQLTACGRDIHNTLPVIYYFAITEVQNKWCDPLL